MPGRPDFAWLDRLHDDFVEAFRSGDAEALSRFFNEDAVMLPPARTIVAGREAVAAYWKDARRIQDLIFEPTSVKPMSGGTSVREAGNLLVTARRGEDGPAFNTAAKYVAVWIQDDKGWKIDSIMWNSAEPPRRRAGGGGKQGRGGGGAGGGGRKAGGLGKPGGGNREGAGNRAGANPRGGLGQRGGLGRTPRPDMDED